MVSVLIDKHATALPPLKWYCDCYIRIYDLDVWKVGEWWPHTAHIFHDGLQFYELATDLSAHNVNFGDWSWS